MILPVNIIGTSILKKVAVEIDKDYPNLQDLIASMFETMSNSDGLGLAAPQIDLSIRLFVVDGTDLAEEEPEFKDFKKVFINPKMVEEYGEDWIYGEGCLSLPGFYEDVKRKSKIRITYYNENFEFFDEHYDGVKARVIQHEYDHLDGVLFTDRLSALKKRLIKGKIESISKGKFNVKYKVKMAAKKSLM